MAIGFITILDNLINWRMVMATKGTRKTLTASDYKAKLEKAKATIKALEEKAFAGELDEIIKTYNLGTMYAEIRAKVDKSVTDIAILNSIAKALKMKRMEIVQAETKTRAPRKPKAK